MIICSLPLYVVVPLLDLRDVFLDFSTPKEMLDEIHDSLDHFFILLASPSFRYLLFSSGDRLLTVRPGPKSCSTRETAGWACGSC